MNGFLLSLLALTHVLTVCGGAALLFRLTRAGRCGRLMSAVWTIVLLLALIPLRLPEAWLPMSLFGETGSDALIELSPTVITAPPAAEASEEQFTVIEHPAEPAQPVQIIEAPAGRSAIPVGPILFAVWLGGAAVMLMLSLRRSRQLSTTLRTCSIPCEDDETLAVFVDLAHRTGLRRLPELRVLDAGIPIPPCTAGFFSPCIYLPAELPTTHDSRAAILAHELCHIRRRDIWRKLFALAVCSAHWFNPLAHAILPRVYDDLEPACDRDALRLLGGEPARIGYMQTLLEVAAQLTVWQRDTLVLGLGSQKQQIERRFTSMKKTRLNKLYAALALLLVCAMALGAAVIFTACTPIEAAADPRDALTPLTERIVRYQYDLAPGDEITLEMLEGITSLKLAVASVDTNIETLLTEAMEQDGILTLDMLELPADSSDSLIASMKNFVADCNDASARRASQRIELGEVLEEKTFVSFNVNYANAAEGSYEALIGTSETFRFIPKHFFETTIRAQITDDWTQKKVMAYYTLKDYADMETERAKAELLAMFPGIDKHPTYIGDPFTTTCDHLTIYYHFYEYGILDPQLLDSTTIDTAQFAVFPNLATLELVGLTEAK